MIRITLDNLTRRFGSTLAADRVDLVIEPGEMFFLLGPSGCGKTTVMRMIAGLTEPTDGVIRFGDRDVTRLPTAARNTALVFQGYALWPHMTVGQNVAFGLDVRGTDAAEKQRRVRCILEMVRMDAYADRKPGQLSGGQQQRVALARALVVEPEVLLLDEPLSNLDTKLREEMRTEIRRVCNEARVTTVYVTHDQEEALAIADRIAVMREGRVVQVGRPIELYTRPASRFVADFLGRANFIPARVRSKSGGVLLLETPLGELRSTSFPAGLESGRAVTCCIRPESLRIIEPDTPTDNRIDCRHERTTYLGQATEHRLTCGPLTLSMTELRPRPRNLSRGPVTVALEAADVVVLED